MPQSGLKTLRKKTGLKEQNKAINRILSQIFFIAKYF